LNREGDSIEPGSAEEIEEFALSRAPKINLMEKSTVAGPEAAPIWQWLQDRTETLWWGAEKIDWVFERFLINRDGKVVNRYKSTASPEAIKRDIQKQLSKPPTGA
jgi:glutathione peroxidase